MIPGQRDMLSDLDSLPLVLWRLADAMGRHHLPEPAGTEALAGMRLLDLRFDKAAHFDLWTCHFGIAPDTVRHQPYEQSGVPSVLVNADSKYRTWHGWTVNLSCLTPACEPQSMFVTAATAVL